MTRFEIEDLLSKVFEKLPKFGTTLESEFAINWREKKIMFYGKYNWKYELFDKEGNISAFEPVKNLILATPEVPEGGVYQEIDNCDAMVISWKNNAEFIMYISTFFWVLFVLFGPLVLLFRILDYTTKKLQK